MRWVYAAIALAACGDNVVPDPVAACFDPPRGRDFARFRDATPASGIDFRYDTFGFQGGGLAVADLDGDGLPEIVASRRDGGAMLFRNRGGLRWSADDAAGISPTFAATAIAAVDLDNDDDRDLVLASKGLALVLANRGDGRFDEAQRLEQSGTTEHVLPVDLDGDGLVELHFSNYDIRDASASQNRIYRNRGGLTFELAGLVGEGLTWTTSALDFDDDGDQDLYVANDTLLADFGDGDTSQFTPWPVDLFLRNDGMDSDGTPRFTNLAADVGLTMPRSSMGGLVADFDEDGRLDVYVTDFGPSKLFVRDGDAFVERAGELGVRATHRDNFRCGPTSRDEACLVLSWSAVLTDFDLDGYDELLVVNGETTTGDAPPVLLFARGADLPYHEVAPGLPCMDARGLITTDLDGDGDSDVVVGYAHGPLAIYENEGRPAAGRWLNVRLQGQLSNREGLGAVVTAHLASGRTVVRALGTSGVIHSSTPTEVRFGLGDETVLSLTVRWPSGHLSELTSPSPGELVVTEP